MEALHQFFFISLLIIIIPGPDFFIVINETLSGNAKNGVFASLGISFAHVIYSAIAALGLIFLLASSYYVYTTIKILGAIYIAYLGIKTILHARQRFYLPSESEKQYASLHSSFKNGFMSTMLNPKAILFYVSVLPQFVSQHEGPNKIMILSIIFIIIVMLWFSLCSLMFSFLKQLFNQPLFKAMFDYIVGFTLIGLAFQILKYKNV
ncbi:LysE family translocator [Staphylococcus agnetis]|uniref:LysE family translocator n=1 Tax=Staphylococcus agnetis TaxID=985762 RepID=A0ABD7TTG9_9STAP|nr:LysE family translocator [Staphylococcus agnetis]UXU56200.1 LysE family translocator [Staphylococcus agnetis]